MITNLSSLVKNSNDIKNKQLLMALYAPPKFGKSTFASGFENALFIASESGLNHIQNVNYVNIESWSKFEEVSYLLCNTKKLYDTIIIDTIDNLNRMLQDFVKAKYEAESIEDIGKFGKGYARCNDILFTHINNIIKHDYNLVIIGHTKLQQKIAQSKTKNEDKWTINLSDSTRTLLLSQMDIILFGSIESETYIDKKTNKLTTKSNRFWYTSPTGDFEAGDRSGLLPTKFENKFSTFKELYLDKLLNFAINGDKIDSLNDESKN